MCCCPLIVAIMTMLIGDSDSFDLTVNQSILFSFVFLCYCIVAKTSALHAVILLGS